MKFDDLIIAGFNYTKLPKAGHSLIYEVRSPLPPGEGGRRPGEGLIAETFAIRALTRRYAPALSRRERAFLTSIFVRILALFLRSGYRLIADPLFDKVAGMVCALAQIELPAILCGLFMRLEVGRNRRLTEAADFFRLF